MADELPYIDQGCDEAGVRETDLEEEMQWSTMNDKINDFLAWTEIVDNKYAQVQRQATRICNLAQMMDYGCEAWKFYLKILVRLLNDAQKQIRAIKKETQKINWQRKSLQTQGGKKLTALKAQWIGLVSKNCEIEQAVAHLEEEILKAVNFYMNDDPPNDQEPAIPG